MGGFHWWATDIYTVGGVTLLAAWLIWGILSVVLHELSHGWMAIRLGDDTPIHSGHMTWDPLVHMGERGLIMLALIGLPSGAMPIDPTRMRGRYADAVVSFAGPGMNFLLAIISILAGGVVAALNAKAGSPLDYRATDTLGRLQVFFFMGSSLNIALALFNLMPCPPLDGSRILANISRGYRDFVSTQGGQVTSMIVYVAAFFLAGRVVFGVGGTITAVGTGVIGGVLHLVGVGR